MKKFLNIVIMLTISTMILTGCGGSTDTSDTSSTGNETSVSDFDSERQISVVSREDGSGTRSAFIELFGIEVKDDNGNKQDKTTDDAIIVNNTSVVMSNIQNDPYSIGYISLGSLNDTVKALKIDGASATSENIKNGSYKVSRPFNIATKSEVSDATEDFINFIMSDEGQSVVSESYISVDSTGTFESTYPTGKIVIAGSSSVTPVMEKLVEAYQEINPNVEIELQMSDSSTGLKYAMDGTADIGMASRELTDTEKEQLNDQVIALDGIAVIVNNYTPIDELTSEQVRQIYTGEVTNWADFIAQ